MNFKKFTVFFIFVILIMVSAVLVSAEEPVVAPTDVSVSADQQGVIKNTNDAQWAWGEVVNVDVQAKTLTLKYLDYETDQEKDLVLIIDENTVFENIKSLDGVKVKDTLSIDYMITAEGKNLAKNINFEQPDATPPANMPLAQEVKPEVLTSAVEEPVIPAETTITTAPIEAAPVVETVPVAQTLPASTPVEAALVVETTPAPVTPADQAQ